MDMGERNEQTDIDRDLTWRTATRTASVWVTGTVALTTLTVATGDEIAIKIWTTSWTGQFWIEIYWK